MPIVPWQHLKFFLTCTRPSTVLFVMLEIKLKTSNTLSKKGSTHKNGLYTRANLLRGWCLQSQCSSDKRFALCLQRRLYHMSLLSSSKKAVLLQDWSGSDSQTNLSQKKGNGRLNTNKICHICVWNYMMKLIIIYNVYANKILKILLSECDGYSWVSTWQHLKLTKTQAGGYNLWGIFPGWII